MIRMKSTRGFTLIELLVVIAIIGILSSVVLASLNSARKKGRDARRIADVKQMQLALELYYDQNSNYPTAIGFGATSGLVSGGYIAAIPSDPSRTPVCSTGAEAGCYKYAALGSGTSCSSYHLGAILETSGHSVLSADSDGLVSEGVCTSGGTNFAGASADCGTTAGSDTQCYDVKP